MEAWMTPSCVTEFLCAKKKVAPIDFYCCSLNADGDHTADVSAVRQWVVCFSSGGSGSPPEMQIVMSTACRLFSVLVEMHHSR